MAKRYKFKVGQEVRVKYNAQTILSTRAGFMLGMSAYIGEKSHIYKRIRDRGNRPRTDVYRLASNAYLWDENWLEATAKDLPKKVVGSIYG